MVKFYIMENRARWLTDKYILLMLLAFPLWTGFHGYRAITEAKFSFFAILTLLWLLGLLLLALRSRRLIRPPFPSQWAALAFILSVCVSALLSEFGSKVLLGASRYDGLLTLVLYGAVFLGVSRFGEARRRYVYALAISAGLCCAVALLQLHRINALWLFPDGLDYYDSGYKYSGAFLGTIGNTDLLAAFLCLSLPLFAVYVLLAPEKARFLLLLPAALGTYVLLRSGVASGVLGLLCCALFALPFLVWYRTKNVRLTVGLAAAELFLIGMGLTALYFWPGTNGTLWELSQVLHGNVDDSFGSSRVKIWREVLGIVGQRPLFGGGPDTLTLRTQLGFERYVEETGILLKNHVDNAHNEFLNYLVNTGAAGLLCYLALIALVLYALLRHGQGAVKPALCCALICYFAQSFFGLGLCLVVPLVWIFLGLGASKGGT